MVFGVFYLLWKIFSQKDKKYSYLFIFFIVPLFFNVFLLDRYEDFRYIYHVVPYSNAILTLGIYFIFFLLVQKKIHKRGFILFLFVFLFYKPMLPFLKTDNYFAFKSILFWEEEDGALYLHRRAVAPQYKKAFNFLNANQKPGDVVIFGETKRGINPKEGVDYYAFKYIWDYKEDLINLKNNQEILFTQLIKSQPSRIWFLGAYIHMLPDFVNQYFLENCQNISDSLGIFRFNYNEYYKNRFFWPNLFLCEFNNKSQ